jgi:hypothetical protein
VVGLKVQLGVNKKQKHFMKARIIERTAPSGRKTYVIQQRHWLFRWWWVDASLNSLHYASCNVTFDTLKESRQNLCWFDGTKYTEKVVG